MENIWGTGLLFGLSVEDMQEAAGWMWTGKRGRGARLLTRTIQNTKKICTKTGLLGTGGATKSDEFSEKLQTVFDIPLIFGILEFLEYHVAFFSESCLKLQNAR